MLHDADNQGITTQQAVMLTEHRGRPYERSVDRQNGTPI